MTAAKTRKIDANKLAHESNRSFIQDDLEPMIVKDQNNTMAIEMVALTMLTKHVQKLRESANTDTSSEKKNTHNKYNLINLGFSADRLVRRYFPFKVLFQHSPL